MPTAELSSSRQVDDLLDKLSCSTSGTSTTRRKIILLDGGTGEELFRRGVPDDRKIWSATAVVNDKYHNILKDVHRSFIQAGSQIITTNSYGLIPGVGFTTDEMVRHCATAGRLAREVADESAGGASTPTVISTRTLVFGSLGPLVESYRPDLVMEHEKGVIFYTKMGTALLPFVDAFLGETLSSLEESKQVVDAISRLEKSMPCFISYTVEANGCVRSHEKITDVIPRLLNYAKELQVQVSGVLFNCAEPEAITNALKEIHDDTNLTEKLRDLGTKLGAYPNRLTPVPPDWTMAESEGPQSFRTDLDPKQYCEEFVKLWTKDLGAELIGGCCGITPEHISYIKSELL